MQDVRRVFTNLEEATTSAKAAASGYRGTLRIVASDGTVKPRLSSWLARCCEEGPEIEIRLFDVSLAEQLRGLRKGHFDAGFACADAVSEDIAAQAIWQDMLMLAVALALRTATSESAIALTPER
ncbi:LysR substrate-binding domain-containing protein [Nitrosomonas eutropha]|uniref:LysR substrate binding domain-containing protein n=2 Tax=Nitrosomonas eutropha TaxID=916 RepID=A0ABX5M6E7_9PROT|nr:LysR substrate-binding domain-containing protein [Nitrosomonas eutropha]ABI58300.1 transcriptional regulator, LysR family protein [Nitrosomonas eutropha C91]PXV79402.1 LysR substrate binding domain-containing protein [Nitrosomonas eutropha]